MRARCARTCDSRSEDEELTVAELLAPISETPGGAGDLVDPEDPATVGRILSEVGTVLVDDLADGSSGASDAPCTPSAFSKNVSAPPASASPGSRTARSPSSPPPAPP